MFDTLYYEWEIETLRGLSHTHVVRFEDCVETADTLYVSLWLLLQHTL
jgi:hypothetical protein